MLRKPGKYFTGPPSPRANPRTFLKGALTRRPINPAGSFVDEALIPHIPKAPIKSESLSTLALLFESARPVVNEVRSVIGRNRVDVSRRLFERGGRTREIAPLEKLKAALEGGVFMLQKNISRALHEP